MNIICEVDFQVGRPNGFLLELEETSLGSQDSYSMPLLKTSPVITTGLGLLVHMPFPGTRHLPQ